jgi:Rhodanese-related sulfurtransferase
MEQYTLLLIFLAIGMFLLIQRKAGGKRISPAEAKKRLETEKGVILLDVRTKAEYQEKHIPKSILIPVDILENEANRKIPDKNAEIFVYCKSGSRSAMAVKTLKKLGYTHINNLGGIMSWPYETVSGNK